MLRAHTKFFCSDRDDPEFFGNWYLEIGHCPPLQHFDNLFDINKPAPTNLRKQSRNLNFYFWKCQY